MKKCQYCAEEIQDEAIKCRHCGESVGATKHGHKNETHIKDLVEVRNILNPKLQKLNAIPVVVSMILLLVGLFPLDDAYYKILRLVVCGTAIYMAWIAKSMNKQGWVWTMIVVTILDLFLPFDYGGTNNILIVSVYFFGLLNLRSLEVTQKPSSPIDVILRWFMKPPSGILTKYTINRKKVLFVCIGIFVLLCVGINIKFASDHATWCSDHPYSASCRSN